MNGLRLILLLVRAIAVAGVHLYSRRAASPPAPAPRQPRLRDHRDPGEDDELGELPAVCMRDDIEHEDAATDMPAAQPARAGEAIVPPVLEEKIIALNTLPQDPEHRFP